MKSLKKIDRYLGVIDKKVRLINRLNPSNANSEKRKFFYAYARGRAYNPLFRYKITTNDLSLLSQKLSSLSIIIPSYEDERWFFSKHLENKRKRIIKKIQCVRNRGTTAFAASSMVLFGMPSQSQIKYAEKQFSTETPSLFYLINDSLSCGEAALALQKHIDSHSLLWRVKIRKNITSKAGLDSRSKYLLLKEGEHFAPEEVESLAVHEVETHIFRKENGSIQDFSSLFGEGFAGPPTTEEGLAFYNETQSTHDPRRLPIISARTIAVHLAGKQSFYETFKHLTHLGVPAHYAWTITLRSKRGLGDTSMPGSFSKDHHYLKGYLEVKKFLKEGGDLKSLYVGKLNIGTAKSLLRLGIETKPPKYLPKRLVDSPVSTLHYS